MAKKGGHGVNSALLQQNYTLEAYYLLRPSNLPVVVAQADERLANGTQKTHTEPKKLALAWLGTRIVFGPYTYG